MAHTLDGTDVDDVLMGGVGTATLARPRSTDDIDLFVTSDHAGRMLEVPEEAGFTTKVDDPVWLYKAFKDGELVDVISAPSATSTSTTRCSAGRGARAQGCPAADDPARGPAGHEGGRRRGPLTAPLVRRPRHEVPVIAVPGNHDHHADQVDGVTRLLTDAGVEVL